MADHDEHREGLEHDLPQMQQRGMVARGLPRRGMLGMVGALGLAAAAGCATGTSSDGTSTDGSGGAGSGPGGPDGSPPEGAPPDGGDLPGGSTARVAEGEIPEETGGPYPADGTNGVNILTESGIVRSDLRSSFGAASGVAEGVPLTIALRVLDLDGDDSTPYAGAAVYLWHCDREGRYSLYSEGVEDENYLRGVQEVADDGSLTFTSVFPACYDGRWPHLHFEVYGSLDDATSAGNKLRTSQIAFPADVCATVYADADGYGSSQDTFAGVSLDTDGIFSDGYSLQMGRLTGSVDEGYTLRLNVPV